MCACARTIELLAPVGTIASALLFTTLLVLSKFPPSLHSRSFRSRTKATKPPVLPASHACFAGFGGFVRPRVAPINLSRLHSTSQSSRSALSCGVSKSISPFSSGISWQSTSRSLSTDALGSTGAACARGRPLPSHICMTSDELRRCSVPHPAVQRPNALRGCVVESRAVTVRPDAKAQHRIPKSFCD